MDLLSPPDPDRVYAHQQDTAWVLQDPTGTKSKGVLWDMRALQFNWPLHGRPRWTDDLKVKLVSGVAA